MSDMSRRDLIRYGAAGAAAAATASVVAGPARAASSAVNATAQTLEDEWEYKGRKLMLRTVTVGDEVRNSLAIDGVQLHIMKDEETGGWLSGKCHYVPKPSLRAIAEASVDATAGFPLRPMTAGHDGH